MRWPVVLVVVGFVLAAGTACTGSSGEQAAGSSPPPVLVPGKPGEPARTATPGERLAPGENPASNAADVKFAQMMIPHHEQALTMTALARSQAKDSKVKGIAERIEVAQPPEIRLMRDWLKRKGHPESPAGGHGHHGGSGGEADMPGMATKAQLDDLEAARGADFDKLFVELMTTHHQGAITMATDALGSGRDRELYRLAQDIYATQSAEITRMRAMR